MKPASLYLLGLVSAWALACGSAPPPAPVSTVPPNGDSPYAPSNNPQRYAGPLVPSYPPPTATTAPSATAAPTSSYPPPASPSTGAAGGCIPVIWGAIDAGHTAFDGTVGEDRTTTDADGKPEPILVLKLAKPPCDPDGKPMKDDKGNAVPEVQIYPNDKSINLRAYIGKSVHVAGTPFQAQTAHHHRPLVLPVDELTASSGS